ncbi:hypothetical protein BGX33_003124 [Mortierella sp. NVP41]|nr:hypothetical protein BGX33_003124 [Mortierella sp. NVP41]
MTPSITQRPHWLTRTLVPLAVIAATANAACVALTNSKACPGFANLQVDTSAAATLTGMGLGFNISSFNNLDGFDAAVTSSTGFYTSPGSCSAYNSTHRIRYQNSVACAMLVNAAASAKCSSTAPLTMCRNTCTEYATSLAQVASSVCASDKETIKMAGDMMKICSTGSDFSYVTSSDTAACVSGTKNEASTCGFESTSSMCTFCATTPNDACCAVNAAAACTPTTSSAPPAATTTTGATPLPPSSTGSNQGTNNGDKKDSGVIAEVSTAALGAIIGGGVVLILLLFAFIVCCVRRSRGKKGGNKVQHNNGNGANLSRHMSNSSATKYKISSPKLQEEGFSTGTVPSAPIPMTALPSLNTPESTAAAVSALNSNNNNNRISKASSIGAASAAGGTEGKQYCQALYPYQASMADELDLSPGDIVNVHKVFDDGWAVGVNMNTSNEGAFPVVCVMFVDEATLHDDFEDVNMHSMTPMGHREDDNSGRASPRSSMPSRASSPVHLPRRQSSMIRDSIVIPGLSNGGGRSSPLAGSPLAGGNHGGSKLQPPVRDTMMSDASSINRWWDGEGK